MQRIVKHARVGLLLTVHFVRVDITCIPPLQSAWLLVLTDTMKIFPQELALSVTQPVSLAPGLALRAARLAVMATIVLEQASALPAILSVMGVQEQVIHYAQLVLSAST